MSGGTDFQWSRLSDDWRAPVDAFAEPFAEAFRGEESPVLERCLKDFIAANPSAPRHVQLTLLAELLTTEIYEKYAPDRPTLHQLVEAHPGLARDINEVYPSLHYEDKPPITIGSYRLVRPLGHGGQARVCTATRLESGHVKELALKYAPLMSRHADHVINEGNVLTSVRDRGGHEHIVKCFDSHKDDGFAYVAMELLDGKTLSEVADLSWQELAKVGASISSALAYVHAGKHLHLDVSCRNIVLDKCHEPDRRRAVLIDFGLCVTKNGANWPPRPVIWNAGVAHYLAPEQRAGKGVSEQTDIFKLGAVLARMLTGRFPDDHRAFRTALTANASIPEPLRAILLKAMEERPRDRFDSAEAMREAFARLVDPVRRPDSSVSRPLQRLVPVAVAGSVLSAGTLAFWTATQIHALRIEVAERGAPTEAAAPPEGSSSTESASSGTSEASETGAGSEGDAARPTERTEAESDASGTAATAPEPHSAPKVPVRPPVHRSLTGDQPPPTLVDPASGSTFDPKPPEWALRNESFEVDAPTPLQPISFSFDAPVTLAKIFPDGRHLFVATDDRRLRIVDTASREIKSEATLGDPISHVDVSPDGHSLVMQFDNSNSDIAYGLYDAKTLRLTKTLPNTGSFPMFSRCGTLVFNHRLSMGPNSLQRYNMRSTPLFDGKTGDLLSTAEEVGSFIGSLKGGRFVSYDEDSRSVCVKEARSGEDHLIAVKALGEHEIIEGEVDRSEERVMLFSAENRRVNVFALPDLAPLHSAYHAPSHGTVKTPTFTQDGRHLLVSSKVSATARLQLIDVSTWEVAMSFPDNTFMDLDLPNFWQNYNHEGKVVCANYDFLKNNEYLDGGVFHDDPVGWGRDAFAVTGEPFLIKEIDQNWGANNRVLFFDFVRHNVYLLQEPSSEAHDHWSTSTDAMLISAVCTDGTAKVWRLPR